MHAVPSRVLIVGLGSIGRRYCRIIRATWPSIQMAALRSGIGGDHAEEKLLHACFVSIDDALLWRPEFVIIASPAPFHLRQALEFARYDIPLLIEKPVGDGSEDQADKAELLSLASTVPIYVGYVLRQDPIPQHLRKLLASGCLGRLLEADFYCGSWLPDWRQHQDYRSSVSARPDLGGGALLELSHELDLAFWLLGPLMLINGITWNTGLLDLAVEDSAWIQARSADQLMVTLRLNFCTKPARRSLLIRAENGEVVWDLLEGTMTKRLVGGDPAETLRFSGPPDERLRSQLSLFWTCPAPGLSSLCSLHEALEVLTFAMSVKASSGLSQRSSNA